MEGKLAILGLNLDVEWENREANFQRIEKEFDGKKGDLYLLPEMFATGFSMNAERIADRNTETLTWMKRFARKNQSAVAGSVSVFEDGMFRNRFYFVEPDGVVHFYDKRHLFSHSGEDNIYTAGTERVVVPYKGFRFLLQVCYDLRFPVFSRNRSDYDVALYVANWPQKRAMAWEQLLKARAIENQSYVFGLNRIGRDGYDLLYEESSHCYFADGTEISCKDNNIVIAELDMMKLNALRDKFDTLKDGDGFLLHI